MRRMYFMRRMPLALGFCLLALAACQPAETPGPVAGVPPRATPSADVSVAIVPATATPHSAPVEILTLGAGQHLSARGSYSDTETLAAGPMLCQIKRDSPAFQHLVLYPAGTVIFSSSEPAPYDQEDQMLHPAAVLPLSKLEALVRQEWGSTAQIMVTEAYDSRLSHDLAQTNPALEYSLHYEGRSLDVIPWPPNPGRLARLCGLAHAAGFDWVHNEGDHCHLSVEAESLCLLNSQATP
jgi:hypothetical protein